MRKQKLTRAFTVSVMLATLMSSTAFAREIYPTTKDNQPTGGPPPPAESILPLQPMDVTNPPKPNRALLVEELYFYRYEQELSLVASMLNGSFADGSTYAYGLIGIAYLWYSQTRFHFESGFDFNGTGDADLWTSGRWIIHFTGRLRPYYGLGLGFKARAERGLTNLLSLPNYFIRGSAGLEFSFWGSSSVKFEGWAGLDSTGRWLATPSLSYVYAW